LALPNFLFLFLEEIALEAPV